MRDEGDMIAGQQRVARRVVKIARVVLAIVGVYVLLTAVLVIFQ